MKTEETPDSIVLQPETEVEQKVISDLFNHYLENTHEHGEHPNKRGTVLCYYTLDLDFYDDLNVDLWDEATVEVDEDGFIDPEPGSRALVIVTDPEGHYTEEADEETGPSWDTEDPLTDDSDIGSPGQIADAVVGEEPLAETDYQTLQGLAKPVKHIPGNLPKEELVESLREFADFYVEEVDDESVPADDVEGGEEGEAEA